MRVAAVFNPGSGGSDEALRSDIVRALRGVGDVRTIDPAGEASFANDVRAGSEDADVVVSCGGDGTLNLVLNALDSRLAEITFAVVPLGTGNDFARTLGLPLDPLEAAESLGSAGAVDVDIASASGAGVRRLFVNGCMGGFPVKVNEAIEAGTKRRLGPLAFVVGGARALGEVDRWTVVVADRRIDDCIAVGIGNGRTAGGGVEMWPSARPDDGLLNLCALSAGSIPQALWLAGRTKVGAHEESDATVTIRDRRFVIEASPPLEFNVDGELVGLSTPATFEIAGAVRFLAAEQ